MRLMPGSGNDSDQSFPEQLLGKQASAVRSMDRRTLALVLALLLVVVTWLFWWLFLRADSDVQATPDTGTAVSTPAALPSGSPSVSPSAAALAPVRASHNPFGGGFNDSAGSTASDRVAATEDANNDYVGSRPASTVVTTTTAPARTVTETRTSTSRATSTSTVTRYATSTATQTVVADSTYVFVAGWDGTTADLRVNLETVSLTVGQSGQGVTLESVGSGADCINVRGSSPGSSAQLVCVGDVVKLA